MTILIEIEGLYYKRESGSVVFEDAHAEFHSDEKVAIIGPISSGKATLVKLLLGLIRPQKGTIFLFGKDTGKIGRLELYRLRNGIGVVFENAALISNLKVIENITLPLQYHTDFSEASIMERAVCLLESSGYEDDIWELPGNLPSYTKKAVAVARSMALDPLVMIYDRPMEGLDSLQSYQMLRRIDEFHKQKQERLSIVLANDEKDVKGITPDRILRIEKRRLI